MDADGRDLIERECSAPVEERAGPRAKLERGVGGLLVGGSVLGMGAWLLFLLDMALGGGGTLHVTFQGVPVSGSPGAIVLTHIVLALLVTQGILGLGLFKQRPWVGWFGLLFVLCGTLGAWLMEVLPAGSLASLIAPLLGTLPTWVLLVRWARGDLEIGEDA